jgi:hypothetical protein
MIEQDQHSKADAAVYGGQQLATPTPTLNTILYKDAEQRQPPEKDQSHVELALYRPGPPTRLLIVRRGQPRTRYAGQSRSKKHLAD